MPHEGPPCQTHHFRPEKIGGTLASGPRLLLQPLATDGAIVNALQALQKGQRQPNGMRRGPTCLNP
eukprot:5923029-Amphidinium_carterae.1